MGLVLQVAQRAGDHGGGALGRGLGVLLQVLDRAGEGVGGRLARLVDQPRDVFRVVRHGLSEGKALGLDRPDRMVGDAVDFAGELLALVGER